MTERLKLYRVVVYTSGRSPTPKKEFIVLGYDGDSACDLALTKLRMRRLKDRSREHIKIEEVEGPFEEGRILYYRSYNGDVDDSIIQDA